MLSQVVGLYDGKGKTGIEQDVWKVITESLEWCRAGKYKRREERVVALEDGKWWYGVLAGISVTHCLSGLSPSNCTAYVCTRLQPFCLPVCPLSQNFKIHIRLFPQKAYQTDFETFKSNFSPIAKCQWKGENVKCQSKEVNLNTI